MEQFPLLKNQYQIIRKIGNGRFSDVFMARCLTNNKLVAIKIIDLDSFQVDIYQLRKTLSSWLNVDHPNLVKYYGSFISDKELWVVSELLDCGSLNHIISQLFPNGLVDETLIATIVKFILKFLVHFHKNCQIYRELTPKNIFLSSKGEVKLNSHKDSSTLIENGQRLRARFSQIGNEKYAAPEILKAESGYTEKSDIWSLGITAFEMITGKNPYSGSTKLLAVKKIVNEDPPQLSKNGQYSKALMDFVNSCLVYSPEKRPSASDLLHHSFLKMAKDESYINSVFTSNLSIYDQQLNLAQRKSKRSNFEISKRRSCNDVFVDFNFDNNKQITKSVSQISPLSLPPDAVTVKVGRFQISSVPGNLPKSHPGSSPSQFNI